MCWILFCLWFQQCAADAAPDPQLFWYNLEEFLDFLKLFPRPGEELLLDPFLAELRGWILTRVNSLSTMADATIIREKATTYYRSWYDANFGEVRHYGNCPCVRTTENYD